MKWHPIAYSFPWGVIQYPISYGDITHCSITHFIWWYYSFDISFLGRDITHIFDTPSRMVVLLLYSIFPSKGDITQHFDTPLSWRYFLIVLYLVTMEILLIYLISPHNIDISHNSISPQNADISKLHTMALELIHVNNSNIHTKKHASHRTHQFTLNLTSNAFLV